MQGKCGRTRSLQDRSRTELEGQARIVHGMARWNISVKLTKLVLKRYGNIVA